MRTLFLSALAIDLVLIGVTAITDPAFLNQPGGDVYLAEPVVLVLGYAAAIVLALGCATEQRRATLSTAAVVGAATGIVEILNISVETFIDLSGATKLATTAPLILGPFLVWGVVGGWATHTTGTRRTGVLAAVWSAMVTMIIAVTYGLVLALAVPMRLAHILVTDPDFLRSGWTDVRAFVPANTLDNAFTHLLGGLIVGSVMGLIGAMTGSWWLQRRLRRLPTPPLRTS